MQNEFSHEQEASAAPTASTTTAPAAASESASNSYSRGRNREEASGSTSAEIDAFRFECLMNGRYHAAREGFLNWLHRVVMFLVIVAGTGSVVDIVSDEPIAKGLLGAGAAILGAIDLVFDLSNRACAHGLMKRRYYELLADVLAHEKSLNAAQAELSKFSADEEPAFHALLALCWNAAQEMVYGDEAHALKVRPFYRDLKNVFTFDGVKFKTIITTETVKQAH